MNNASCESVATPKTVDYSRRSPHLNILKRLIDVGGVPVSEPLLGRGAVYRRPHWGDALLRLALSLMSEDVAAHHLYHKYYLAT